MLFFPWDKRWSFVALDLSIGIRNRFLSSTKKDVFLAEFASIPFALFAGKVPFHFEKKVSGVNASNIEDKQEELYRLLSLFRLQPRRELEGTEFCRKNLWVASAHPSPPRRPLRGSPSLHKTWLWPLGDWLRHLRGWPMPLGGWLSPFRVCLRPL